MFEEDIIEANQEEDDDFLVDFNPESHGYSTEEEYLEHIFKF